MSICLILLIGFLDGPGNKTGVDGMSNGMNRTWALTMNQRANVKMYLLYSVSSEVTLKDMWKFKKCYSQSPQCHLYLH